MTKLEFITKVEEDLDLQEDPIIGEDEMDGYLAAALRKTRKEIEKLNRDYYLSDFDLALTLGEDEYALPQGVMASKIRSIIYDNGSTRFPIKKVRDLHKFEKIAALTTDNSDEYRYTLINRSVAEGQRIKLIPASKESSVSNVTIWAKRDVEIPTLDADELDVPEEFIDYPIALVKQFCLTKINNGIVPPAIEKEVADTWKDIVEGLADMEADNDDEVEGDYSHYEEHN